MPAPIRLRRRPPLAGWLAGLLLATLLLPPGCVKVKTEVEPIDINVNVRLEVDRELDEFFGELDAEDPTLVEPGEETES